MVKKALKYLAYRFYQLGLQETQRKQKLQNSLLLSEMATIPTNVITSDKTRIINQTKDKSRIKVGDQCIVLGDLLTFQHGGEIIIGDHVFIGEQSRIWSSLKIIIGNRVLISHNVNIHDNISHSVSHEERHEEFIYSYKYHKPMPNLNLSAEEVKIGDDVWIGFNATILKGVTIGDRAIIGANALITKNVPPDTIVIGNPQRELRKINE